jgi:predicted permease
MLASVLDDARYALRGFRRRPVLAASAVLTLTLGIGANATMAGVIDRLLVRPPDHVRDPDRVLRFYTTVRSTSSASSFTTALGDYAGFAAMRDHGSFFDHVAAYMTRDMTLDRGATALPVTASLVTGNFFRLLGAPTAIGRYFADDEDRAAAQPVAVLSHALWRSRFAGDPTILGRTILVHGSQYTVVGVAPARFTGVELDRTDVWLPLHVAAPSAFVEHGTNLEKIGGFWLQFIARLRADATAEAASAEATALLRQSRGAEMSSSADLTALLGPVIKERGPAPSDLARTAKWAAGMSLIVLLIACANVANLLLARALERRREIAVRLALGSARRRLVMLLVPEALLLAIAGGTGAIVMSLWTTDALRATLLPDTTWTASPLEPRLLVATAMIALIAGIAAGLPPALRASRADLMSALKLGERSTGFASHHLARRTLLVLQGTLSVMLLVGAGMFVRSVDNFRETDLGLDAEKVLIVELDLENAGFARHDIAAFFDRAAEAVSRLPVVERASVAAANPFGTAYGGALSIPGRDSLPQLPSGGPYEYDVSPGYFATLGTRILRGRDFSASDRAGTAPVIIINETLARTYWPDENALGRCAVVHGSGKACAEIVGIVENVRRSHVREEPQLLFYAPLAQSAENFASSSRSLVLRARGDARVTVREARAAIQALAPDLPFVDVRSISDIIEPQLRPWRLGAVLFSTFGVLALLVGAIGLYGVINFGVLQRRTELAIRMALGARSATIMRMVLQEGILYMAIAVSIGLASSLALGKVLASLMYDVSPHDITVYFGVAFLAMTVAILASSIPAWRATRVDPATVLRAE